MDRTVKIVKLVLRPGVFYHGEWKENVGPHGSGCEYYADQSRFEGKWLRGKRHGPGKEFDPSGKPRRGLTFLNGNSFAGDWKEGVGPCGFGEEFAPDGKCLYRGEWRNGQREGKSYIDGVLRYDGEWRGDKQGGAGKLFENGVLVYEGSWVGGKRQGLGTEFRDGRMVFKGAWRQDEKHGSGKEYATSSKAIQSQLVALAELIAVAPDRYIAVAEAEAEQTASRVVRDGEWKDDKFVAGKEFDENGLTFQGAWVDGERHGSGTEYKNGLPTIEGHWERGQLVVGKEFEAGQPVYDGEWCDGAREGVGKEFRDGQLVYEGRWKRGVRSGAGTLFDGDKITYEGEWLDGKKGGVGTTYYSHPNAPLYRGEWKEDVKEGQGSLFDDRGFLSFEGDWQRDHRHGYGREYVGGLLIYAGGWVEGLREGSGKTYLGGKLESEGVFAKG